MGLGLDVGPNTQPAAIMNTTVKPHGPRPPESRDSRPARSRAARSRACGGTRDPCPTAAGCRETSSGGGNRPPCLATPLTSPATHALPRVPGPRVSRAPPASTARRAHVLPKVSPAHRRFSAASPLVLGPVAERCSSAYPNVSSVLEFPFSRNFEFSAAILNLDLRPFSSLNASHV